MSFPTFARALKFPILRLALVCAILVSLQSGLLQAMETVRCHLADGFDFPVGPPGGNAEGYYKARGFWPNGHLGEDWNGVGGGDSDLGDPIYSIGHGVVVLSEDVKVGWGNVVIVRHAYREPSGKIEMIDALYGHLHERKVRKGQIVERGQLVGTMGGNNGMYPVHLHFEIRKNLAIGMNRSKFARDYSNYYSPTHFINVRRRLATDLKKYEIPVNTFAAYGGELTDEQSKYNTPSSPNMPNTPAIRRTNRGFSIPVPKGNTSGYAPNSNAAPPAPSSVIKPTVPPSSSTGGTTATPPPPATGSSSTEDFWSRLKAKMSNGQITPGASQTPP